MPDREKVMSWLEGLAQQDWRMFHSDSEVQEIARNALALLEEQKPVIRCKDCKWHTMCGEMLLCTAQNKPHTYDWFCAGGERNKVK